MSELVTLNGINGASGAYLVEAPLKDLGQMALAWKVEKNHERNLRNFADAGREYAIGAEYEATELSEAGWGVIFPAKAKKEDVEAILEALDELLQHRRQEAGKRFKIYYEKGSGYREGESKNEFLARHGAGPGPVNPNFVPYYLLIAGDPQSIPYQFQYELDVDYAVGRICFDTLDEYAHYARSVVEAETPGKVKLPREAVFFSVANEGDRATNLSDELLVQPLAEHFATVIEEKEMGWESQLVLPEQATKSTLSRLLGGDQTPALLFTASHGLGWDYGHPSQKEFQGALLCQDWPGPQNWDGELSRDFYFGGEDLAADAGLLGLVAFHFACFGAGTPYWDAFATGKSTKRGALAPRAFLSALPKRLLGHPKGGAMAVIGHVERAWTYSFKWEKAGEQTEAFKSVIFSLLRGDPVGLAVEYMNMRYASTATMLSNELEEIKWDENRYDPYTLGSMWTANNDARGYAVIGDPAARIPVAAKDEEAAEERPSISAVPKRSGELPEVLVEGSLPEVPATTGEVPSQTMVNSAGVPAQPGVYAQPFTVLDGLVAMSRYTESNAEEFASLGEAKDAVVKVVDSLAKALNNLVTKLADFTEEVASLDVETFIAENPDDVDLKDLAKGGVTKRLSTHVSMTGDVKLIIPLEAGKVDDTLWKLHSDMVRQAQENRIEMIKATTKALTDLLAPGKPG